MLLFFPFQIAFIRQCRCWKPHFRYVWSPPSRGSMGLSHSPQPCTLAPAEPQCCSLGGLVPRAGMGSSSCALGTQFTLLMSRSAICWNFLTSSKLWSIIKECYINPLDKEYQWKKKGGREKRKKSSGCIFTKEKREGAVCRERFVCLPSLCLVWWLVMWISSTLKPISSLLVPT